MNLFSRITAGVVILIIGVITLYTVLYGSSGVTEKLGGVGWGLLLIGVAIYLFLNSSEDTIEEIKDTEE